MINKNKQEEIEMILKDFNISNNINEINNIKISDLKDLGQKNNIVIKFKPPIRA